MDRAGHPAGHHVPGGSMARRAEPDQSSGYPALGTGSPAVLSPAPISQRQGLGDEQVNCLLPGKLALRNERAFHCHSAFLTQATELDSRVRMADPALTAES